MKGGGAFVVGIDLGTTNTVVSYAAIKTSTQIKRFEPLQFVGEGQTSTLPQLPSVAYVHELNDESVGALPWNNEGLIIGSWSRELCASRPEATIQSAKSWLSYDGVDRTAQILPWGGVDEANKKYSPVAIATAILSHIRSAWNEAHPDHLLEHQDVILTVPASFDDSARRLTVTAAKDAGLQDSLYLLEEPQAAFYAQMGNSDTSIRAQDLILVVDVGGGTTDLTLIRAIQSDSDEIEFERVAVGDHLLLGGDNMDLYLAYEAEKRIVGRNGSLNSRMMSQLVSSCRRVKESAFSDIESMEYTVSLPGQGRRLVQTVRSCKFIGSEITQLLTDAFVPQVPFDVKLQSKRGMALSALGLPYEQEPVLTKHVASFLQRHAKSGFPSQILFNGGFFHSERLRDCILSNINSWRPSDDRPVGALPFYDLDGAVAKGAAVFGLARRGLAKRIGGGAAKNFFITVEKRNRKGKRKGRTGICILPKGTPTSTDVRIEDRVFDLIAGRPVQMTISSAGGDGIVAGMTTALDGEDVRQLGRVQTVVESHEDATHVPVMLSATLSEQGLLELQARAIDRDVSYDFEFRPGAPAEGNDHIPPTAAGHDELRGNFDEVEQLILRVFGRPNATADPREIRHLTRHLEGMIGSSRSEWQIGELRRVSDFLLRGMKRRRRSERHEMSFFHLSGFCLRPGVGDAFDEWRLAQLWQAYDGGVHFHQRLENWDAWWICWRRVSGGLTTAQQAHLYAQIDPWLQRVIENRLTKKDKLKQANEAFRLIASLERLPVSDKAAWGERFLRMAAQPQHKSYAYWCLARIGARELMYAGAECVVSPAIVSRWVVELLEPALAQAPFSESCLISLTRCTGDRHRDLEESLRILVANRLKSAGLPVERFGAILEPMEIQVEETQKLLGDSLPDGLRIIV